MKLKILTVFQIVYLVMQVFVACPNKGYAESAATASVKDLSRHPIYSTYEFSREKGVVNIGVQPLYSPTGLITETMKRDDILRKSLSEMGMKVKFYSFLKGDDVNFFLRRGDLDVGIGGDLPAITAAATMEVVIPALVQHGFTSVIANQPMLIRELRGKSIGYAFGSNAHYALLKALSSDGLEEGQVKLVPVEVNEMPDALVTGKIDVFSAWEPTPAIALSTNSEATIIHQYLSSGYIYFQNDFAVKHPDVMRQIVAAEIRSIKWMKSDNQNLLQSSEWSITASEDLTGKKIQLTKEQIASLAYNDIIGLGSAPIIPNNSLKQNGSLHREFGFLQRLGKVPTSIRWENVSTRFEQKVINDVLANQNKYRLNEFKLTFESVIK